MTPDQSGKVPIWVTLTWLPEQVTLNMKFSQQLPKQVTVSVSMWTDMICNDMILNFSVKKMKIAFTNYFLMTF